MKMTYDQRDAKRAEACRIITDVALAGVALGYWEVIPTRAGCGDAFRAVAELRAPNGTRVDLFGGYSEPEKIIATLGAREDADGTQKVYSRDVRRYSESEPRVSVMAAGKRTPEALAKYIKLSLLDDDRARDVAARMADLLADRTASAERLAEGVATLRAAGINMADPRPTAFEVGARDHLPDIFRGLMVNSLGEVTFEARMSVAEFLKLLPTLKNIPAD